MIPEPQTEQEILVAIGAVSSMKDYAEARLMVLYGRLEDVRQERRGR